ncbi:MAG: glycerol kinase GlpK [Spirochaetales bacterium]|nr:glycerol kinase GlpK [Spirochaetales bacterium]
MAELILAVDQGTSGSKAIVFNREGDILCDGRSPLRTSFPQEGFVEQDPEELFSSVISAVKNACEELETKDYNLSDISCCGISNQRETFLVWDKKGNPLTNAVVWQCKRSVSICRELHENEEEPFLRKKTGLFLDPYFSGTKLIWLYRNDEKIKSAVDNGEAYFGTVDTWLLYKLTGGKSYKTDYTNASRTLLFNLRELRWDQEILERYNLSGLNLPEIHPSSHNFGTTDFFGAFNEDITITAMIGDSHAAAFGERCFKKGTAKATMGTGASILLNTGTMVDPEKTSMVSTICWSTGDEIAYALEGIIVSCGSTLNWLSKKLGLFETGEEATEIAESIEDTANVFLIPAFSGLGAPWWKMDQKASIQGLTFGTDYRHIIRAGLESIVFQVTDVLSAMEKDSGIVLTSLKIDGGVSSSTFVTRALADLNNAKIMRCRLGEASALGAAFLAGLNTGIYKSMEELIVRDEAYELIHSNENEQIKRSYFKWYSILEEQK